MSESQGPGCKIYKDTGAAKRLRLCSPLKGMPILAKVKLLFVDKESHTPPLKGPRPRTWWWWYSCEW